MRRLSVLAALLAASFSVAACDIQAGNGSFDIDFASGKATDTWSRSYKVEPNGRFELINVNGRITAESSDGSDVVVEGRRSATASTDEAAKDNLAKLEIREEVSPSTVRVESRPPRLSGMMGGHEIEWIVKVPKGIVVDLRTSNGGVRLNGLSGEVHARSTNGGIRGSNLAVNTLEASVTNGGVDIGFASLDATDSVDVSTVNGGVVLSMPSESKATITARAVNGGVRVSDELKPDADEALSERESRRRFSGTINGGGARVSASTTNGGVRINPSGNTTS